MLSNRMNFSYCVIWNGFPKSSHIYSCNDIYTKHIFMGDGATQEVAMCLAS